MKNLLNSLRKFPLWGIGGLAASFFLFGCEDVIEKEVKSGVSQLVVDAFINDQADNQSIKLTFSQGYFDNSSPKPVLGATVFVFDEDSVGHQFFDERRNGNYVWKPNAKQKAMNKIGKQYLLYIQHDGQEYISVSKLNRVPKIDSLNYFNDTLAIKPQTTSQFGFTAEFFARDFKGEGDCYMIKSTIEGKPKKANNFTLAYDGAFRPGSKSDGIIFILPIRRAINTDTLALLQDREYVAVEVSSLTQEAYFYLSLLQQESSNQGLFSVPSVNLPSNVVNRNEKSDKKPLGFFNIASVSVFGTRIEKEKAKPKPRI
jgi:hypothetical protein